LQIFWSEFPFLKRVQLFLIPTPYDIEGSLLGYASKGDSWMWHGIVSFGYFFSLEAKLQDLTDWLIVGIVDSSENEAFILVIGFVMDGLHALTVEDCIYGL
jgi:hypothetical protein